MSRARIISWSFVILVIVTPIVLGLSACGTSSGNIARVQDMSVTAWSFRYGDALEVTLKPTASAQPNTDYVVKLYENNKLRATTTVNWNQPQINVLQAQLVEFPISVDEYNAYVRQDFSHIFTVRVEAP